MARYIDADELMKELEHLYHENGWSERDVHFSLSDTRCNLLMIPAADVAPVKHGTWTEETQLDNGYAMLSRRCSNCYIQLSKITITGNEIVIECDMRNYRYCPNCGARMDLEDEP